jgi:hypothetical protein
LKKVFMISSIDHFRGWKECFECLIKKANNFNIIYQGNREDFSDDDIGLNVGKKDFSSLSEITIEKYNGMADSFIISGSLTEEAIHLFYKYVSPSFDGFSNDLWSFEFLLDEEVLLQISDKSVCAIRLQDNELEELTYRGADINNLELLNYPLRSLKLITANDEGEVDIKAVSFSKEELEVLAQGIERISNELEKKNSRLS